MGRFTSVALLLLSPGILAAAPGADATSTTGLWKVAGDVMGRSVNMMCQITEADRKLNGTCSSATDGYVAHKIAGSVKAQKVQFYFQTSIGGGSITLIVSGTLSLDRSKMDGDLDVEPMAVGGIFQAVRQPESGAATEPAPSSKPAEKAPDTSTEGHVANNPVNLTGTWIIDGDVQGTPVKLTCVLTQTHQKLAGTCTGAEQTRNALAVTGEATVKDVAWHFDAEYQGQPITVALNATLDADGARMAGTMAISPLEADGTFVGVRQ